MSLILRYLQDNNLVVKLLELDLHLKNLNKASCFAATTTVISFVINYDFIITSVVHVIGMVTVVVVGRELSR